jgi:DNA-binding CsgD family transcriptional regulator
MGDAIRRTVALASMRTDERDDVEANGLVIVADDHVVALGGAAEHWLARLGFEAVSLGDRLPVPLLSITRRLQALEASDSTGPTPSARLSTTSGGLVQLHATRLRDAGNVGAIALSITPADSAQRASLLLAAHGLTPAQRRVAELVLHGDTTRQIVAQLRISEYTVQDHLKAVFDKLGVRSRRDLVAAVMRPHR